MQKCCCACNLELERVNITLVPVWGELHPSPLQNSTKQPRLRSIVPGELFSTARSHSFPFCNQRVKPPVLRWNRILVSLGSKQHQAGGPSWGPVRKGQWPTEAANGNYERRAEGEQEPWGQRPSDPLIGEMTKNQKGGSALLEDSLSLSP